MGARARGAGRGWVRCRRGEDRPTRSPRPPPRHNPGHVRKGERGQCVVYADRFTPEAERARAAAEAGLTRNAVDDFIGEHNEAGTGAKGWKTAL